MTVDTPGYFLPAFIFSAHTEINNASWTFASSTISITYSANVGNNGKQGRPNLEPSDIDVGEYATLMTVPEFPIGSVLAVLAPVAAMDVFMLSRKGKNPLSLQG